MGKHWGEILGLEIVDNWRGIVSHSGSWWTLIAGLISLAIPETVYELFGIDTNPFFWGFLGVFLYFAGIVGRLLKQGKSPAVERARVALVIAVAILAAFLLSGRAIAGPVSEAETLKVAVPFIAAEEGERTTAYLDIVGVPTICFGSTRGVRIGMTKTHEECLALLSDEVAEFREKLHTFFTSTTINTRLTPHRDAAYTSTAFNCGIAAIGNSTATRRLNAGNIAGGCEALTWWNSAGGRVVRGLVGRRARERSLCMTGL